MVPEVKLVVGMLAAGEHLFTEAEKALADCYGHIDCRSSGMPFSHTRYYEKEMGKGLIRRFISFERLIHPGDLAGIKLRTNLMENRCFSVHGRRQVNLDPGYIAAAKLVLATTKDYEHRIYLREGIFAEVTLHYREGSFIPWEWTYPDYRTGEYIDIFNGIRKKYLDLLKKGG